jgi:hypothetical protein
MKKTKVYINIPAKAIAGGVESLFQLADAINNVGGESIVLWDMQYADPIPEKYKHYNIQHSKEVEDTSDNWIIYPEVWTEKLNDYKNLKKSIWWLSVDNNHGKFQDFSNSNITHFYQSFYALDFLQKNGVEKYLPLFDYIPSKYTDTTYNISEKKNIVCYNPVKGLEITNQIKSLNPDLEFVPIVGMDENQIIDLLKISKVYIDFGHHPGRDRIPRESAILGNCVITNLKGAAGFYNDVPVSNQYKSSIAEPIGIAIRNCFDNYESVINDFSLYRSSIKNQKEQLYNLAKQYFTL